MALFKTNTSEEKEVSEKTVAKEPVKSTKKSSMKDLYGGKTDSKKADTAKTSRRNMAYRILVKPLITEKAAHEASKGKYHFQVSDDANKISISEAISEAYGITPTAVNVISVKGKAVARGRVRGQRKDWKKAIVTLPTGKTINIYEGV
jgi:large subunit ribosomal protein L23